MKTNVTSREFGFFSCHFRELGSHDYQKAYWTGKGFNRHEEHAQLLTREELPNLLSEHPDGEFEVSHWEVACTITDPPITVSATTQKEACDSLISALWDRGFCNLIVVASDE